MSKKHTIHPENCRNRVRETVTFCGMTITLSGKYAYEWSIMKECNGKITVTVYPDRVSARKGFNKYK